ncbi:MAG: DUF2442 domain-containing protein [Stellaceae bacterium]|jgi:hypothetical protein
MNSSVRPISVRFDDDSMWVELSDGRILGIPLAWFPRLLRATRAQRETCRFSSRGLHWQALDEDISVAGLLAGRGDETHPLPSAAQ